MRPPMAWTMHSLRRRMLERTVLLAVESQDEARSSPIVEGVSSDTGVTGAYIPSVRYVGIMLDPEASWLFKPARVDELRSVDRSSGKTCARDLSDCQVRRP